MPSRARSRGGRSSLRTEPATSRSASRKDARDAVARRGARSPAGRATTAYNRGQVLYRLAEMMEARARRPGRGVQRRATRSTRSIDRVVWYAGWADKLAQVARRRERRRRARTSTSRCPSRPASSATLAPDEPALEGIVSRILPALVSGNVVVAVASESSPLAAIELAEAVATSDMPGGALNILTGRRSELAPILAGHADVNAIDITGADGDVAELERLAAGNVKRVVRGMPAGESLWEIEPMLEMKTVWHPVGV